MTFRIYVLIFALLSSVFFMSLNTPSAKAHDTGEDHTHTHNGERKSKTEIRRETRDWRSGKLQEEIEERHKSLMKQFIPETRSDNTISEDNDSPDTDRTLIYRGQKKSTTGKRLWNSY